MKVGATGSTTSTQRARKADARGAIDGPVSLSGVEAILATQSVDPDGGARVHRLARRGEDILDRLEGVRLGLLTGAVPKDDLADLARLVRSKREEGVYPRLGALLDEIELRAEVELVKLTRGL